MPGAGKTMRKFILAVTVVLFLCSCAIEGMEADGFQVVAADFPSYDAARAVLGSSENLVMLLPPGTESHSYDPTPRDMVRIAESRLVVYTGGPSDEWLRTILSSLDEPPASFALTEQVELLHEEHREGMEEEENHDHNVHEIDEHVWTSPRNEIQIIRSLAACMGTLNSADAALYERNAEEYIKRIEALDNEIQSVVSSADKSTLIFASRFPLLYFVREYGLEYYAAFPGCAEESEPSARTVAFLIDKAKELDVSCILNIEFSSPMIATVIADEAGCGVEVFNTLHNVTAADFYSGKDYVDLMEENIAVLQEALN